VDIRFKSIRLKRFRSFLEETTVTFDDAGFGLYFLKGKNERSSTLGSNGAGKSTILDALVWCLFGRTVRGLKNPDVVPWTGKGATEVEVCVSVDNTDHTIKRTIGPNLLTINDQEVAQQHVDDLIQIPIEIVPYTLLMGQDQPLFFDKTAGEKLEVFSSTLNLDRWEKRSTHANELARQLEKEIEAKSLEVTLRKDELERAETTLADLKRDSEKWESSRSESIENSEKQQSQIRKRLEPLLKQRDTADLALDRAETELRASKVSDLVGEESRCARKESEASRELASAKRQVVSLQEMIASISDECCPTCQQPIKSKKMRDELAKNIEGQIAALGVKKLSETFALAQKAHHASVDALDIETKAMSKFKQAAESARDTLDTLSSQISSFEADIRSIDRLREQFEKQDNPYRDQIQKLRRHKDGLKAKLEADVDSVVAKTEYYERVRYWVKGFKDIKLYTLTEILQELEITTNGMLDEFGLSGWEIQYDIERENKSGGVTRGLNIVVLSPDNDKLVKWGVWSGGEAQRLKIIGSLALGAVLLNHLGISTNLTFFDEPTKGLSKEGVTNLVDLLADYAKDNKKNVWLIDHHVISSNRFALEVQVTKNGSGSCVQFE